MSSFVQRLLSGLVYVALFIGSVLYSKESFVTLTAIFGIICIYEFSKLIKSKAYVAFATFASLIVWFAFMEESIEGVLILLGIALTGSIQTIIFLFSKKLKTPSNPILKEDITVRYLVLSFGFLMFLPFALGDYEPYIIIYLLLMIWANDSFAFLVGKNFGRNKLYESVSPKKTIEGFFGGVLFTVITAAVIAYYSDLFTTYEWVALALIVSILGTIGDLVESKFKRLAGIKDSGNIMPGHGGMYDRLDSLLFVAPFVYLYIYLII